MRNSRKIVLLFLVLAAALLAGLEYLNRVVLPAKARQWAEAAASQALGRPVTIGRLRIHLWHGFLLEEVTVLEDPQYGPGPLLEADQISGGILFLPILRDRELIIPSLHIVRPRLRMIQGPDGRWNLEGLLPQRRPAPAGRPKFGVLVPGIVLTGGEVELTPHGGPLAGTLRLSDLKIEVGLFLPARVEWTASADLRSDRAGSAAQISLSGTYTPQKDLLQATAHAAVPLGAVWEAVQRGAPPSAEAVRQGSPPSAPLARLLSLEGSLQADLELSGRPKGPLSVKGWMETEGFRWEMPQPFLTGWEAEPPDRLQAKGEIRARIEGEIPPLPDAEPWRGLQATVTLDRMAAGPLPYVGELREIAGDLLLDARGMRMERITASLATGLPLELSGSLLNDTAGTLGFQARSAFPLEQLPPLPAQWEPLRQSLKPTGRVQVEAGGTGSLRPSLSLRPSAAVTLEEVALQLPGGRQARDLRGSLRVQPDLLTMTGIRGQVQDRLLQMEGTVAGFAQPEISAELSWGDLSAQGQATLFGDKLEIHALTGRLGRGAFRVIGEIGRPHPEANLLGEATVHLEELASLWPAEPPAWLRQNPARGEVSARVLVEGDLRRPADLRVDLKASSPALTVRELSLRQVSVDLRQEGGRVNLNSAGAEIAQGTLDGSGSLTASDPEKPWKGRLIVRNVELAALAEQLQWKTRQMSGQLQADWEGGGEGADLASLSGPGTIRIHGAQILELPLLGRFAELLSLPSLNRIAFQEAQGPFRLAQGKVQTDGFMLTAPQATLTVTGSGGFLQGADSPIAWRVLPTLSPELIPEESRAKIGKVIAKGASYLIGEVIVEGTWKTPRTRFVSRPLTEILGDHLSNLQELLGDLF